MDSRLKRIGWQLLGWTFLVLGIAGLVLPVLQGILFLFIGLFILSRQYEWARRWMDKLHRRYPGIFSRAEYWLVRLGIEAPPRAPQVKELAVSLEESTVEILTESPGEYVSGIVSQVSFKQVEEAEEVVPLSGRQKVLAAALVLALLFGLWTIGKIASHQIELYWADLQDYYKVLNVKTEDSGYQVELQRNWTMNDRRYVLRCHVCGPVEVGSSYRFELVPASRPPMMKRAAAPGEVPDYYTVLEGSLQNLR